MTPARLGRIRGELAALRASEDRVMPEVYVRLALRLGRVAFGLGGAPLYIRTDAPHFDGPMVIPSNGRPVRAKVATMLLDQLGDDADTWEQFLLLKQQDGMDQVGEDDDDNDSD